MNKKFNIKTKIMLFLLIVVTLPILGFKVIGTSYCYIKTPQTKQEADDMIEFCGGGGLFFDVFLSKSRTNIYENYPDNFQNKASATEIISYYTKNNPLQHLNRIEFLTNVITDESWNKKNYFYFLLDADFFENNLPLEFRQKVFKKIYEKYYPIILKNNELSERDKKFNLDNMNKLKSKLKV